MCACSKSEPEATTSSTTVQSQNAVQGNSRSDFESAYKAAEKLRLQAAALGYEWSNTEEFLLDAKKAFVDGDKEKAMQLVKQAHAEADLAVKQAKTEASAWKARVVK